MCGESEVKNYRLIKQEAHGPYRSPRKPFQSMNTFAQSCDLKRKKKSPTGEVNGPYYFVKTVSFTQECFVKSLVELGQVVLG